MPVRTLLVAAGLLAAAAPARAQEVKAPATEVLAPRDYQAGKLAQPTITLGDAVLLTLRHNPAIVQGAQTLRAAQGRYQESRGVFDPTLRLAPSATWTLQQIPPGLRGREFSKRETIRIIRDNFTILTEALRGMIANTSTTPPRCPSDLQLLLDETGVLDFSGTTLNLDLVDPTEAALRGVDRSIQGVVVNLGDDLGQIDLSDICSRGPRKLFSPEAFLGVWREAIRVIDFSGGRGLQGVLESVSQIPLETRILQEDITRTVAQRANLALDRLGPVATDELTRNVTLDVNFFKPLRSGVSIAGNFQMQAQEHNFVDKPLDPTFGGLDTPPQFFTTFNGTLTLPLGRGRGAKATAASERAARSLVAGEEEQLRHATSEEVFRTVLGYLDVIAAQQRVQTVEASLARQREILRLSQLRVNAGQIAGVELERVRAREATVLGQLARAQADLNSARVSLADTIGVTVDSIEAAPLPSEAFATATMAVPDTQKLIEQALALRRDTRAASARREAAAALFEGAKTEARPLFDVTLTVGMSNLYESPFFKYLPDEAEPIIDTQAPIVTPPVTGTPVPAEQGVRYWGPRGYFRALTGRFEPFATVKLTWEIPFGNNAAKGRVAQAQASLSTSSIDAINLDRVIRENIVEVSGTVARALESLQRFEAAVASSAKSYDAQQRLLEAGNVTLIDVLLTEEGLATDQQQLLLQRQTYLSALARLKFELGELVLFDNPGTTAEVIRFLSSGIVGR
jgi:outer membrane protein TolC